MKIGNLTIDVGCNVSQALKLVVDDTFAAHATTVRDYRTALAEELLQHGEVHDSEEDARKAARALACVNFVGDEFPTDELPPGGYSQYIIDKGAKEGFLLGALQELLDRARQLANHCDLLHQGDQPFGAQFNAKVTLVQSTIKRITDAVGAEIEATAALADELDVPFTSASAANLSLRTVKHKYVRHSAIGFVLFPHSDDLYHKHIGDAIRRSDADGEILSAGFAYIGANSVVCNGESESLGIKSRADDSQALTTQLAR